MLWLLLASLAGAAPQTPVPVALERGEDLQAWEALTDDAPPAELQAFILTYPTSPLAELAWMALRETPQAEAFSRKHRGVVQPLERSRLTHEARLAQPPRTWSPVPLPVEATSRP